LDTNSLSLGTTSIVSEPAAANHGNIVFMTGNTWAARSTDGGNNFSFVNPFSDFPVLCCDQDVVYNDVHDVWIWYRQGFFDSSLGGSGFKNEVKINVSTNDALTWCTYTLTAPNINSGLTDHFIDYPHLQTTDDKLYISTNIFDNVGFDDFTAMLRFDLSELSNCGAATFQTLLSSTEFNYTPVNGATDTMYFGTQLSPTQTRMYSWQDSSSSQNSVVVSYPSYSSSGYSCPMPDTGTNPCDRSDPRILGGYLSNGVLGFVWDAAQGGSFSFPYVNYITVNALSGSLLANTPLFSNSAAANFANFGVNNVGDIGIGLFLMGGALTPNYLVGIDDSQTGTNQFDFVTVKTSTHGPNTDLWGDYVRIKPFKPDNGQWVGTGFTMQGGTTNSDVENLFVIFGRFEVPSVLPSAVTDLTASPGIGQVTLSWTAPPDGGDTIIDYIVEFKQSASPTFTVFNDGVSASTGATVTGLTNGISHDFQVKAVNSVGTGSASNVATATTVPTCLPPSSGDWVITSSCILASNAIAPANVIVQNNSVLTIPAGLSLDIDFINNFLKVEFGSGVRIKAGGTIT